ncbi:hypothetical protein ABZP36_025266 [Zizania latifolia]
MAQVDADSRSATARNDDEDHGDAVGMAPVLDADSRSASGAKDDHQHHIVIDIDAGDSGSTGSSDDAPCCVVCTEPLEHVAVGRCGHRAVCSLCAARIRSGPPQSRRCCICRTVCPTVVVTNTAAAAAIDGALFTSSKLPAPASGLDERIGEYWYCAVISAYFDDEQQYKAAAAFLKRPPPPPTCPNVAANLDETLWRLPPGVSWRGHVVWFLITVVFFALIGASLALVTVHNASDMVARVSELGAVWALLAALAYILFVTFFHCFYQQQP